MTFSITRQALSVIVITSIAIFFCTIAVILRCFARARVTSKSGWSALGLDDVLVVLGWFFAVIQDSADLVATRYGLGQNVVNVPPQTMVSYLKCTFTASITYQPAITFTRLSILAFYSRSLATRASKAFRYVIYFLGVFISLMLVWGLLVVFLQCKPVKYVWQQALAAEQEIIGSCIQIVPFYYIHASIGCALDVIIYCLPMNVLWKLQLPKRQRVGLLVVFGLGAIVCIASFVRIAYLHQLLNSDNPTTDLVNALNWSTIEINLALICASIPALKPLFAKYFPTAKLTLVSSWNKMTGSGRHGGASTVHNTGNGATNVEMENATGNGVTSPKKENQKIQEKKSEPGQNVDVDREMEVV